MLLTLSLQNPWTKTLEIYSQPNIKDEIREYQRTMQSLNHDIINNTNDSPLRHNQSSKHGHSQSSTNYMDYTEKLERQQNKYDELLRECEKYRNEHEQLIEYQIEIENMRKETLKIEKRNKLLSDQIVELTYNNVQLEKEINECNQELEENQETIQYLENENEKLMTSNVNMTDGVNPNDVRMSGDREPNKLTDATKRRLYSQYGGPDTSLDRFVMNNSATMDLKRRLSVQLRDNFGYNENLVMFANKIDENGSMDGSYRGDGIDELHEEDLFTIHQNYEDNQEYLVQNMENINGTDHGDREESMSELSDAQKEKQVMEDVKVMDNENEDQKKEEEEKADSVPPKNKDNNDISPLILANKSREEKAIDPKAQRKGTCLYIICFVVVFLSIFMLLMVHLYKRKQIIITIGWISNN